MIRENQKGNRSTSNVLTASPTPTPSIQPKEIQLILCCARVHLGSDATQNIQSIVQKEIDWEYIVKTALHHRVMPLMYQNLQKICPQAVPADTLQKLRTYFLTNTKRNLIHTDKLLEIINILKEKSIVAIPFKGPVLAESVYGNLAHRQFADLDILVHKEDVLDSYQLLLSHSYDPEVNLSAGQIKTYLKTEYSLALNSKDSNLIVELHWDLTGRHTGSPFGLDRFDNRLETATLAGNSIAQFPTEELLIYLCIHGSKDCWNNLDGICSVAELIRSRVNMDWERVIHSAAKIHCRRMLFLGLELAHQLLDAVIPVRMLAAIKTDPVITNMAEKITATLFSQPNTANTSWIGSDFSMFHLDMRKRFQDKLRYALNLLFLPSRQDWRYFSLPANLSFLLYPLRPLRLVRETGTSLLKF